MEALANINGALGPVAACPISSRPPPTADPSGEGCRDDEDLGGGEGAAMGGGGGAGNRWPREETVELIRIRSEMDAAFRDATVKGPLWDDVSRKLKALGYTRSAKKCREKFENVQKYHKRTKDGRAGRQDGKNYRFFAELELLHTTATTTAPIPASSIQQPLISQPPVVPIAATCQLPSSGPTGAVSSDTSSWSYSGPDDESEQGRKRKRGLRSTMAFFEDLMKQAMQRQESKQLKFFEAMEKREQDRIQRQDSWKQQEVARMDHERELLAQHRAAAASRDAAVISLLQRMSAQPAPALSPKPPPTPTQVVIREPNGGESATAVSSAASRWPKPEVHALIGLRSEMEARHEEEAGGPKGSLWEEISKGMERLGYGRSAKRCKEKWENINKYFRKVKESNRSRPEDAKTCPYFHQLDALYNSKKFDRLEHQGGTAEIKNGDGGFTQTSNGGELHKKLMEEQSAATCNADEDDEEEEAEMQFKIQFRGEEDVGGGGNASAKLVTY